MLYFSNKENRIELTKLLLDEEDIVSSTEPTDHNFTTLGGHNSPSFHDNYACIPFGRDIIEVNLNAQPPIARRKNLYAYESAVQDPHFHKVDHRNGIVSGEFITVSQNKHYFCYIPYMQPSITCRVIEDMVKSENDGNKQIEFPGSLLPGVFSLSSMDNRLIVKRCVDSEVYQVLDEPLS